MTSAVKTRMYLSALTAPVWSAPTGRRIKASLTSPFLRHIPNLVLMMPKDENEGRHMVNTALNYEEGPIAMRFPRGNGLGVKMDKELKTIPIGTWEVLRPGKDAVILTFGTTIEMALEAAEELQKEGLSVRVVNARFIKPIDKQMMKAILNEGLPILTIEEAVLEGGFGDDDS